MTDIDTLVEQFPPDFIWGAATSAYQIEGAWDADGKGESIWDRFVHTPGKIDNGETGDVAADHYHRWESDLTLMKEIGLQAYRFSVSWPRVLPQGRGSINQAGLDFYSRLVDGLLENGILPFLTIYHWDLPQALQEQGGWPSREIVPAFVEYADVLSRALGDRVKFWNTINEPRVVAWVGYYEGRFAPGHQDAGEMLRATHHLFLAHAAAMHAIRANIPDAQIGPVVDIIPCVPASPSDADQAAARLRDGLLNRALLDPLAGRGYPEDVLDYFGLPTDFIQSDDLERIVVPNDFLGINYYTRHIVRADIPEEKNLPPTTVRGEATTEMGWEVYPDGLTDALTRIHADYAFPNYFVTENGAAFPDKIEADGRVRDGARTRYLESHFAAAARALQAGVPLTGYFVWSLMDNFEWAFGYRMRFGLIHIDYETQTRTLKDSARWYQSFLTAANERRDA